MDRDRTRVLLLLGVHVALVVASLLALDWFVAYGPGGSLSLPLRALKLGGITFYGTLIFTLLVGYQALTRIGSGVANDSLSKLGYFVGLALIGCAGAAGFMFAPEPPPLGGELLGISVERTSAPFLLLLAHMLGISVLYYAVSAGTPDDVGAYKPIAPIERKPTEPPVKHTSSPPASALQKHPSSPPASALQKHPSSPPAAALQKHPSSPPASALQKHPSSPPAAALAVLERTCPKHLEKKLKFVALTAEITRAGIDARREDGTTKLVMWRDVVGLVARRMPADYDGLTFLDVVSTAGSTIRLVAWTRLTGEVVNGEGDAWSRALLSKLAAHCPTASLDPATKRFQTGELAAQLPDLLKLAAHDDKLA